MFFAKHIEKEQQPCCLVDVFIYVFVNEVLRIGNEGVGERDETRTC